MYLGNRIPLVVLALLMTAAPTLGQWAPEGVLVHEPVTYSFGYPCMCPDGTGGMYVFFSENLEAGTLDPDAHVVRVDGHGRAVWPAPVPLLASPGNDGARDVCPDGAGGAFVVYHVAEMPAGGGLWLQRVGPDGTLRFSGAGIMIYTDLSELVRVVPDGQGGVVIVYEENQSGSDYNLLAQRVSGAGVVQWGAIVSNAAGYQWWHDVDVLSDGSVVVVWQDSRDQGTSGWDIYAQRIALDGTMLWPAQGLPVCTLTSDQGLPRVAANPLGGAVVVWSDDRLGASDIFGQYLAADGSENWTSQGRNISGMAGAGSPDVACFGNGDVAVAWVDGRYTPDDVVAAQYVTAAGSVFMPGGLVVSNAAPLVSEPTLLADGFGGVVMGWRDDSMGPRMLWGQRYDGFDPVWNVGAPLLLSAGATDATFPAFGTDGYGGLLAVYRRDSGGYGWAQRVGPLGDWGLPAAAVAAVEDVPADEGGWVRLRCTPSRLENGSGGLGILGYNVWRQAEDGAKTAAVAPSGEDLASGAFDGRALAGEAAKALQLPDGTWESVGYHAAVGLAEYLVLAPTRTDSSSAGPALETFCITTHTDMAGVVYASLPDSGWSVDNLAPDPPKDLGGSADWDAGGVSLQWDGGKSAGDIAGYNVYRGETAGFPADPAHLLGTTTATSYFDDSPPATPHYKVTAFDRHGNESLAAELAPQQISGIDTPVACRNRLAQNRPNPFNPSTVIVYELERAGPVWLRVHDVSGRLVRTLVAGATTGRGPHEITWHGDDDAGRAVAAGVYVVRFETAGHTETRRMALIR